MASSRESEAERETRALKLWANRFKPYQQRLIAEKAELERQFNDLTVLRAQVAKLKQAMNIARRLEWIRQGLFASSEQKGAQKLMQGLGASPSQTKAARPAYDLNVEVGADGRLAAGGRLRLGIGVGWLAGAGGFVASAERSCRSSSETGAGFTTRM